MSATAVPTLASRARWIHRPSVDLALGFAWVPFVLAALALRSDPSRIQALAAATLLFSLAHQPLTLGLVYGDPAQFALKKRLFIVSPFVFVGALIVGLQISFVLVAVIAGLWNAEHTLMQRYGLTRIYGRKGGDDHGGLEKAMLVSWLVGVLVFAAADTRTPAALKSLGLGARNREGVEQLITLRPVALVALPIMAVVVLVLTARWWRAEQALGERSNPAKHLYVGSTAVLFVVMLVDPVVGFIGYVGAHAAEYFVIVHQTLGSRYAAAGDPSPVGRAARSRLGAAGTIAAVLVFCAVLAFVAKQVGSARAYSVAILTVGALHIFYDGFIWKLRRPDVARSFSIDEAAARS